MKNSLLVRSYHFFNSFCFVEPYNSRELKKNTDINFTKNATENENSPSEGEDEKQDRNKNMT